MRHEFDSRRGRHSFSKDEKSGRTSKYRSSWRLEPLGCRAGAVCSKSGCSARFRASSPAWVFPESRRTCPGRWGCYFIELGRRAGFCRAAKARFDSEGGSFLPKKSRPCHQKEKPDLEFFQPRLSWVKRATSGLGRGSLEERLAPGEQRRSTNAIASLSDPVIKRRPSCHLL